MKYRVYFNHSIEGPYEPEQLLQTPGFTLQHLVCPDGDDDWSPASAFPAFTRTLEAIEAAKEPVVTEESPAPLLPQRRDWREAVIGGDIPEMNYRAYRPPQETSSVSASETPAVPAVPEVPKSRKRRSKESVRKRILLGLLGLALAIYAPQADSLLLMGRRMTFSDMAVDRPFLPPRPWTRLNVRRKVAPTVAPRAKPAKAQARVPGKTVTEVASEDLGNGTVLKTIVEVLEVDGLKTFHTKTITVRSRARRARTPRSH